MDGRGRRIVGSFLGLLAFAVLVAAPVHAETSPVLGARVQTLVALDVARFNVTYAPGDAFETFDLPGQRDTCSSSGHVDLAGAANEFRFTEGSTQAGCATVSADIPVPLAAESLTWSFRADRDVVRQIPSNGSVPTGTFQQRAIVSAGDTEVVVVDFYAERAADKLPFADFDVLAQVPQGASQLRVTWSFFDNAISPNAASIPTPGDACSSTVRLPLITYAPLPLATTFVEVGTTATETANETRGHVEATVSSGALVGNTSFLWLDLASTHTVTEVTRPDGSQVGADQIVEVLEGPRRTLRIGPLAAGAGGTYGFTTLISTPLPPAAPPAPPTRVDGLAYAALVSPLAFAVVASVQAHRYRRVAERSQRVPVVALVGLLLLASAGYVVLVLSTLLRDKFDDLAVLPVHSEGWRIYLALGALVAAFLIVALAATIEARRARDLRHARQLERSNRDLEAFASAASHDLQEPLRDVQNALLLLDEKYGAKVPLDGRSLMHDATRGAERMRDLVRGVLAFAKADDVMFSDVRLDGVVTSARALVRGSLRKTKARVRVDPLPAVHGDAASLVRLFENLLTNAVKFHGKQAPKIHISARRAGALWRVEVADNGTGIAPADRERVFRLFERLHGPEVPGVGLGLALCARIVERHGGTIGLEDTPGGGTTVYFTLPAVKGR